MIRYNYEFSNFQLTKESNFQLTKDIDRYFQLLDNNNKVINNQFNLPDFLK